MAGTSALKLRRLAALENGLLMGLTDQERMCRVERLEALARWHPKYYDRYQRVVSILQRVAERAGHEKGD